MEQTVGDPAMMTEIEKVVLLRTIDDLWIDHLESMDYLRHGIGLQGYGQRDPLVEYKRESYRMFHEMTNMMNQRVARTIFKIRIAKETAEQELQRMAPLARPVQLSAPAKEMGEAAPTPVVTDTKEVGRNEPCPCGSGKKYKKCHGS